MADHRGISGNALAHIGNTDGAPLFVLCVQTVSGTSSYTLVSSARFKFRVLDVLCYATAAGGAGDTITVTDGTTAITDAMDLNIADTTVARAGTIDDATRDIRQGGTLKVTTASGAVGYVEVLCAKV